MCVARLIKNARRKLAIISGLPLPFSKHLGQPARAGLTLPMGCGVRAALGRTSRLRATRRRSRQRAVCRWHGNGRRITPAVLTVGTTWCGRTPGSRRSQDGRW